MYRDPRIVICDGIVASVAVPTPSIKYLISHEACSFFNDLYSFGPIFSGSCCEHCIL